MKTICGLLATIALLGWALTRLSGCATGPNPCIGSAQARLTMPCTCPGTLNGACEPWIVAAKKPDGGTDR